MRLRGFRVAVRRREQDNDFGRRRHVTAMARAEAEAAEQDLAATRLCVEERAKIAFLGVLSARRAIQEAYNIENGITPQSIVRSLDMSLVRVIEADYADLASVEADGIPDFKSQEELDAFISKLDVEMRETAKKFEFERAAKLRDRIKELRTKEFLFA